MAKGCGKSTPKCAAEPFIFLYTMCYGANITLFPQLVIRKLCHQRYNNTVCKNLGFKQFKSEEDVVYSLGAAWNATIFSSICIPALFTVLPMGAFASMVSKRKVLYLPPVVIVFQAILYMFCARYQSMPLGFIALAAGLTGIFGDLNGAVMLTFTYMASVTNNDHVRTLRFAILEGCLSCGKGFGGLIAGLLLRYYGFTTAFSLSLVASFLNILFITLFLQEPPESDKKDLKVEESVTSETSLNLCSQFLNSFRESCINVARFARKYFCSPAERKSVFLVLLAIFFEICALSGEDIQGWSCPYGDSGSRSVPKVGFFSLIQGQLCPQKFVFIAFREVGFFPPIFGRSVTGQGLSQKPACIVRNCCPNLVVVACVGI